MEGTGPIPTHYGADASGQLIIGGYRAADLVSQAGGTPLFVYDNDVVGSQIARFKAAFPDGFSLFYNVTANSYPPLLRFIARYVDGFRVVSVGELDALQEAGIEGIPIKFDGRAKSAADIEAAVRHEAILTIESDAELSRVAAAADASGIVPQLILRVAPPAASARTRPRGVAVEDVPDLFRRFGDIGVPLRGLQMSTAGSCLEVAVLAERFREAIAQASRIADLIDGPVGEICLGGGLGVPCHPGEQALDLDELARIVGKAVRNTPPLLATSSFAMDVGRWLVAEAGTYLTTIIDRQDWGGEISLTLDGGGHHLSAATMSSGGSWDGAFPIAIANGFSRAAEESVTLTGCRSAPSDVFAQSVMLPRAQPGDLVAIFCAGAYGLSESPHGSECRPSARQMLV